MNRAERRKQERTAQKIKPVDIARRDHLVKQVHKVAVEEMAKAKSDAIKYASDRLFLVLACCLHDKWGWGETRIFRLIAQINDLFDSIDRDYVSFEDLAQDLEETAGIKIISEE